MFLADTIASVSGFPSLPPICMISSMKVLVQDAGLKSEVLLMFPQWLCVCTCECRYTHVQRCIHTYVCLRTRNQSLLQALPTFYFFFKQSSTGTQDLPSRLCLLASKPWRSTTLHFPWLRLQIFCTKLYICSGVQTEVLKLVRLTIWNKAFSCPLSDVLSGVSLCYQLGCISVMSL